MTSSKDNSYILIEDSHNLSDDAIDDNIKVGETKKASSKMFEKNGIFVEKKNKEEEQSSLSEDAFSKELMEQSGIEIIPLKEGEE